MQPLSFHSSYCFLNCLETAKLMPLKFSDFQFGWKVKQKKKRKKKKMKEKEVKLKFWIYQKQVKAKFPAKTQIYDDFIKKHHLLFKFLFDFSKKFFKLYSMCFKNQVKEQQLYIQKKVLWGYFNSHPRQQLWAQNTSVRIGLNKLTEPFDTLNYRPSFKHCLCFSF